MLWGAWKDSTAPTRNHPASGPTHQQTSHMSSAATHYPPCPQAKQGKREPSQGFQARQENCSPEVQCVRYLLESQSDPSIIPAIAFPMLHPTPRHDRNSEERVQLPLLTWLHCQSGHIALTKQVLWGSPKDLWSSQLITWQAFNLFSRQAAWAVQPNHSCHISKPNGAKESPCRIFKPDRKNVVPNCSARVPPSTA